MAAFVFIGNGKSDPESIRVFGYQFQLNGDPVDVNELAANKLAHNSHFIQFGRIDALPSDKNELEALARDRFGVELDKRKTVSNLQRQVQELIDGSQDGS